MMGTEYRVQLVFNLYHKDSAFVGRTYRTALYAASNGKDNLRATIYEYVLFQTAFRIESVELIVEVLVCEVTKDKTAAIKSTTNAGWTALSFQTDTKPIPIDLFHGSAMRLVFPGLVRNA